MAITWTTYTPNTHQVEKVEVTHAGRVLAPSYTREVRAMSDVYCDASYVSVWNPETSKVETICLGYHFECCCTFGQAEVDASPEVLAEVAREAAEAEVARQDQVEARRQADLAREAATPRKGKTVRVAKGRKVPVGIVGTCIWIGDGSYGPRCGVKDGDTGEVYWTALSNVEVVQAAA